MLIKSILFTLLAAVATHAQALPLPAPDRILQLQEREARERAAARRIEWFKLQQQQSRVAVMPAPGPALSARERKQLHKALARFFREHPGVIIDARTGKRLEVGGGF